MDHVLHFFTRGDVCSTILVLWVLLFVGNKVTERRPAAWSLGLRLGGTAGLVYGGIVFWHRQPADAAGLLPVVLLALAAFGFVTALSWIMLPALSWAYRWTLRPLFQAVGRLHSEGVDASEKWRRERLEEERRRRDDEEYARRAPERERARQEAEARARAQAEAQRKRENARADCLLFYNLHAAKIADRFPRERYDEYVSAYLTDQHPPEVVEDRARKLAQVIEQQRQQTDPPRRFTTLADIAAWCQAQQKEIDALPDSPLKQSLRAQLNARYAEMSMRLFEESQP